MSNSKRPRSQFPASHQRRRYAAAGLPEALETRRSTNINDHRELLGLMSAHQETIDQNVSGIRKRLELKDVRLVALTDTDAKDEWRYSKFQLYLIECKRQTGIFVGIQLIESDEQLDQIRFHDRQSKLIGLHLVVSHETFETDEGTILGYDFDIKGPGEPGREFLETELGFCAARGWMSSSAAKIAQKSNDQCQQMINF